MTNTVLHRWVRTEDRLPPDGVPVVVLNGTDEFILVRDGGLWFTEDLSMYVYYVPTMWRHIPMTGGGW